MMKNKRHVRNRARDVRIEMSSIMVLISENPPSRPTPPPFGPDYQFYRQSLFPYPASCPSPNLTTPCTNIRYYKKKTTKIP